MKTRPILFSAEMVRAILSGDKTQTRRGLKKQTSLKFNLYGTPVVRDCPYGEVGDKLYVRETWKVGWWDHENFKLAFDYKASPEVKKTPWVEYDDIGRFDDLLTKVHDELLTLDIEPDVDEENEVFKYHWSAGDSPLRWRPGIHMPKEAARIWLEITNIRVERLKDITERDAMLEGVEYIDSFPDPHFGSIDVFKNYTDKKKQCVSARDSFKTLWQIINGAESWNENPWVWVVEFKKIENGK